MEIIPRCVVSHATQASGKLLQRPRKGRPTPAAITAARAANASAPAAPAPPCAVVLLLLLYASVLSLRGGGASRKNKRNIHDHRQQQVQAEQTKPNHALNIDSSGFGTPRLNCMAGRDGREGHRGRGVRGVRGAEIVNKRKGYWVGSQPYVLLVAVDRMCTRQTRPAPDGT